MKVKFIRSWNVYKRGAVIDCPDGQANLMIRRGIVELVVEVEPKKTKRLVRHA